jgi:DNA polymerase
MDTTRKLIQTIADIQSTLGYYSHRGVTGFDCGHKSLQVLADWGRPPIRAVSETLTEIRTDLGDCQRCRLAAARTKIVFGEGDPSAKLVFVGEGPGRDEDLQGLPFVGAAGQLLTKIIAAMNLTREQVYICNIIKCRPPQNRDPQPDEIETCIPFLLRQLAAIRPLFVCALGKFATQTLLGADTPISRLRGRFHEVNGLRIMPTYHPAYLLRNPEQKRAVWEDMQQIMKDYPYEQD